LFLFLELSQKIIERRVAILGSFCQAMNTEYRYHAVRRGPRHGHTHRDVSLRQASKAMPPPPPAAAAAAAAAAAFN
jgi:hypothetical protein